MHGGSASQRDGRGYQLDSLTPHHQRPSKGDSLAALGAARENQLRRMERGRERENRQERRLGPARGLLLWSSVA